MIDLQDNDEVRKRLGRQKMRKKVRLLLGRNQAAALLEVAQEGLGDMLEVLRIDPTLVSRDTIRDAKRAVEVLSAAIHDSEERAGTQ